MSAWYSRIPKFSYSPDEDCQEVCFIGKAKSRAENWTKSSKQSFNIQPKNHSCDPSENTGILHY